MFLFRILLATLIFTLYVSPVCQAGDTLIYQQTDHSLIKLRIPHQEKIDTYLQDKDYHYGDAFVPTKNNGFFQKVWTAIIKYFAKGIKMLGVLPTLTKILLLIAFAVMVYIIATRTKLYRLFTNVQELPSPKVIIVDENTFFEDFDSAIAHERSKQNYRNAVRLMHLKILRELEKNKFIRLSIDKTNYDYTRELKNSPLKQNFIGLTNHYNHIWYGNQTLSAPDYESLESSFQQYTGMINAQHE